MAKRNPRTGSRFDDFLKEEGFFEEVQAKALKRALAEQLEEGMQAAKLTKLDMAKKMATSRSQLDRVLDPSNVSVQLDTLIKAARARQRDRDQDQTRPQKGRGMNGARGGAQAALSAAAHGKHGAVGVGTGSRHDSRLLGDRLLARGRSGSLAARRKDHCLYS